MADTIIQLGGKWLLAPELSTGMYALAVVPQANSGVNIGNVDPVTSAPAVYNKTLTSADTEYSQAMPTNCRAFEFQCRTAFDVRYQYVTGKVATPAAPWMTMKSGGSVESGPINQGASPSVLYLASAEAGVIVEITAWI